MPQARASTYGTLVKRTCDRLRMKVQEGEWKPGEQLRPEKVLAKEMDVSPMTMRMALRQLEKQGLFWSQRGKGRFVADAAKRQRRWVIGVVVFDISYLSLSPPADRFAGIQEIIGQSDYHLRLFAANPTSQMRQCHGEQFFSMLELDDLDGVIVIARQVDIGTLTAIAQQVPVTTTHWPMTQQGLGVVNQDWSTATFLAARHLLGLGHRQIALIHAKGSAWDDAGSRAGMRAALHDVSATGEGGWRDLVTTGTKEDVRRVTEQALSAADAPTAIICGSFEAARGVRQAAKALRLDIPGDLSVVTHSMGMDDEESRVSYMKLDCRLQGKELARLLLSMIDDPSRVPDPIMLPTYLVDRGSTGPAQAEPR